MSDVLIVLGCSKVLKDGIKTNYTPKSHVYGRLCKAVEIYKSIENTKKLIICSGGFGQAQKMKIFLISKEIPQNSILIEPYSKNTIENCIFSYELLKILFYDKPSEMFNLHLITDDYHMKRSQTIFNFFSVRLSFYKVNFYCHSSKIINYLPNPTSYDIEEINKAYKSDDNIFKNFLKKDLHNYQNWFPEPRDYMLKIQ